MPLQNAWTGARALLAIAHSSQMPRPRSVEARKSAGS